MLKIFIILYYFIIFLFYIIIREADFILFSHVACKQYVAWNCVTLNCFYLLDHFLVLFLSIFMLDLNFVKHYIELVTTITSLFKTAWEELFEPSVCVCVFVFYRILIYTKEGTNIGNMIIDVFMKVLNFYSYKSFLFVLERASNSMLANLFGKSNTFIVLVMWYYVMWYSTRVFTEFIKQLWH